MLVCVGGTYFQSHHTRVSFLGNGFGSEGTVLSGPSFIPRFDSQAIDNSPNYAALQSTTIAPEVMTAKKPMGQDNIISDKSEVGQHSKETEHSLQTSPLQTYSTTLLDSININASQNVFHQLPSYSGIPGMLGTGSQLPVSIAAQQIISGIPAAQYLPPEVRNATDVRGDIPVYTGFPGMIGEGHQVVQEVQDPNTSSYTNTSQVEEYSKYIHPETIPGTSSQGNVVLERANENTNGNSSDTRLNVQHANATSVEQGGDHGEKERANEGQAAQGAFMSSAPGSLGLEMVPAGVNKNNWSGEWPGKLTDVMFCGEVIIK